MAQTQAALTEARRVLRMCQKWAHSETARVPPIQEWVEMADALAAVLAQEAK